MAMTNASTTAPNLALLTDDTASWTGASLLSVSQITPAGLQKLFSVASDMRHCVLNNSNSNDYTNLLKGKVLATIFFEASTRTACSFQASMLRLGGTYMHVDAKSSSAGSKGESLTDTVKCLQCYVDAVVLRHGVKGSVQSVIMQQQQTSNGISKTVIKPVINAGDGVGEHPTQALLDVFTIYNEFKLNEQEQQKTNSLVVVMLGDLKHGRTVHSLAKLLCTCAHLWTKKLVLRYCAPDVLQMPDEVLEYVNEHANNSLECVQETFTDPALACKDDANVLYVTRVQRERFVEIEEYEAVKGTYVIDANFMQGMPSDMIVMHPLPRVDEISIDVDGDPRAAYFRQMENGMYVRMAILALIFGKI